MVGVKPCTAVNEIMSDSEMDADLAEYENAMLNEEYEMMCTGPEGVEPCAPRMGRPTQDQCLRPHKENDDFMHDIQYSNDNTADREDEANDNMEDGKDEAERRAAKCRGQKRRLHTVCEISYVARGKMVKHLGSGIT